MQVLLVYANTNQFSYEDYHLHRSCSEGDYTRGDLEHIKKEYINSFASKTVNKLSITHMDISNTGEVTIIDNIQGEHPLKVRREINPAALEAKKARQNTKVSTTTFVPANF